MKTIFLGGIHGVGKSTIIQGLMQGKEGIGHYSFGENVRDIGRNSGTVQDIQDFSGLSNEIRSILMQQAKERFRKVLASQLYETLLVDNHFSVYENKQLVKAIDDEELELYDTLILVEVPIDILHERISKDNKERTRESCDRKKILQHSKYERSIAEEIKKRGQREVIEVENIDLKETIEKIQEKIQEKI